MAKLAEENVDIDNTGGGMKGRVGNAEARG